MPSYQPANNFLSQSLGNAVDWLGTALNLPEMGISERVANGQTTNTYNYQADQGNVYGPVDPRYYQTRSILGVSASPTQPPANNTNTGGNNNTGGNGGGGGNPNSPANIRGSQIQALKDSNPAYRNMSDEQILAAQSQNESLLSGLNSQYDYNKEQLNNQLGSLSNQKENTISELELLLKGVQDQVATSRTTSAANRDKSIAQAGDTAKTTQQQNRNVLRGLGILNSSAAGELLSKPMNEFDKQRANFVDAYNQRSNELDTFLNQKVAEHSQAVKGVITQFNDLAGKIQSDLRFNDRQRADAIKAANSALQQRLADIQMSAMNFQQQVELQKQQFGMQLAAQMGYKDPTYNQSAFNSLQLTNPTNQTQQIGITPGAQNDELMRRKQGLLGSV